MLQQCRAVGRDDETAMSNDVKVCQFEGNRSRQRSCLAPSSTCPPGGTRASRPRTNISFAGLKERTVWIPFEMISGKGEDEID